MRPQVNARSNSTDLKAELFAIIRQRKSLTESLATLERQIYLFEGSYLDDTAPYGNIIKGWDRYLMSSNATATGSSGGSGLSGMSRAVGDKRARKFRDSDRLFSRSSVTSMASLNAQGDVEKHMNSNAPASNHILSDHYNTNSSDFQACGTPPQTGKNTLNFTSSSTGKKKKARQR